MSDGGFPRRDSRRRIVGIGDLVAVLLAGTAAGAVALVGLDGLFALLGLGDFGEVNGWLAVILPVMLLVEEFRAWRGARARVPIALAATVVAIGAGLLVAGLIDDLPGVVGGVIGAVVFSTVYAPLWFYGVRMVGGEVMDK